MARSTTESDDARVRMTHIVASGMTTTALSGEEPTTDSTGSDDARSESTATDSSIVPRWIVEEWTEEQTERFLSGFSDLWKERIVEELEPGIFRVSLRKSSTDGSNGLSPEEVEPCD
jgi:hypothetical protein